MFSKRLINSARFLKMPVSSQCLYFHLGLNADDDGVVEAFTVMNSVGASEDDLKILAVKGFVKVLNEDLVTFITDWRENNKIRSDRKIDSIYKDLLLRIMPEIKLIEPTNRADRPPRVIEASPGQPNDAFGTSPGQPWDGIGKGSVVEDSLDQVNLGEGSVGQSKTEVVITLGAHNNVYMTEAEYSALTKEYPHTYNVLIENFSAKLHKHGYKYNNHYATILKWASEDGAKGQEAQTGSSYNLADFERAALDRSEDEYKSYSKTAAEDPALLDRLKKAING